MFPCEFCEVFKHIYFEEHLPTAVSYSRILIRQAPVFMINLRSCRMINLVSPLWFFHQNPHFTGIISKKYCNLQALSNIASTWEKGKNKLKESEIEVTIITKAKRHKLCSNWQIFFMSDTDTFLRS